MSTHPSSEIYDEIPSQWIFFEKAIALKSSNLYKNKKLYYLYVFFAYFFVV